MSFWKTIEISKILDQIPNYKDFLTIEELDNSSKNLAEKYETVDLFEIGKSTEGRCIN